MNKRELWDMPAIAYYGVSNVAAIEIIAIDDYDEKCYWAMNISGKRSKVHGTKIYNSGSFNGPCGRIKLSECPRV